MRPIAEIAANNRLQIIQRGEDGMAAYLVHPCYKPRTMAIIASWGGGWDHVSVSFSKRCPTWDEMCMVKDIFWSDEECVVQYHPPRSTYVNNHPYCLHLWKPQGSIIDVPPTFMVGQRNGQTKADAMREAKTYLDDFDAKRRENNRT